MTDHDAMPPTRHRRIPGMAAGPAGIALAEATTPGASPSPVTKDHRETHQRNHRRAADYAATRVANFRVPVDLHDRFKALVRDVESMYPRLRHPSLTELVIALLEEGPQTADEVAEMIRRKRAAEHEER